ncbi:hypothetical protein HUK80_16955 [Flavobacterium sp. MAH-1]|uniref:DUF4412 domain-containing protein n=1 Tax=Flavobacterium agri TaxID=2743471 RepID=A0A7Y9C7Q3_9FLAO|nr:hypothetical protein [Flavobacterium agri]NUY82596.1 hypothetical protein [Flavobacterium agri]NYA72619.1 hypothetical protein [Flavobacterium agri]
MKKILFFALMSFTIGSSAQDTIVRRDNEVILGKVMEIRSFDIVYKKFDRQDGPSITLRKDYISQINYQDGKSEDYSQFGVVDEPQKKRTLAETKDYIVKTINEYGYERDSNTRKLKATFEGELLRLVVMNKKYTEAVNDGWLYDFSTAAKFHRVSKRPNNVGLLNIWVGEVVNEKKMKTDEVKLIIEIHDHAAAEQLRLAFMHLRDLQKAAKPQVEQF